MGENIALAMLLCEFVADDDLTACALVELTASVANAAAAAAAALTTTTTPTTTTTTTAVVEVLEATGGRGARSEGSPGGRHSLYPGATFRDCYRVERSTFQTLCERLAPQFANRSVGMEKKILCSLWLLGNQESFQDVANRFGMGKGTLHYVFRSVVQALSKCQAEAIKWPSVDQLAKVAQGFRDKSGFPGVVGALGGTHIPIRGPPSRRNAYVNRSGFPSIHLQAVCDSRLRFLDVDTGRPGSTEGAEALRKSPLWSRLEGLRTMDYHLLADSAYPLETFLLSPYGDDGHLTELQRNYNRVHGSTRADIERAFGLLRRKWRRLKYLDMTAVAYIPAVISAACVLHNFLIDIERLGGDETDPDTHDDDDGNPGCANRDVELTAASKRDGIARTLATTGFRTSRTSPE
uniref:Nuclease HARBI1 n=1 Tax=Petromyzon marinus TaxID=7757 RepID=A0AAJ7XFK5_PETMA|nr:putative nuclease HARBI1 [Petromyzon marinus]